MYLGQGSVEGGKGTGVVPKQRRHCGRLAGGGPGTDRDGVPGHWQVETTGDNQRKSFKCCVKRSPLGSPGHESHAEDI